MLLLIEVADSTLAYDQRFKRDLYAKHEVAHGVGEVVAPQAFPEIGIAVSPLFG